MDVHYNFCPCRAIGGLTYLCDPLTVLAISSVVSGAVSVASSYESGRKADKAAKDQKKQVKTREAQLASEAAAAEAARKKAESAGSRAGFGADAPSARSTFLSSARGGTTGFSTSGNAPAEDKIGRATLFGN